jgi:hypothetical protein
MEYFIQYGNFRISFHLLPRNILFGINIGEAVDENTQFHNSVAIGLIFVAFTFVLFDEKLY